MKQLGVNGLGPHCKWKAQPRRLFDAKPFITWSTDYFCQLEVWRHTSVKF